MSEFIKSKKRIILSPGESIKIARELLGWSQQDLAKKCGIPQSTISGIESGRITLGLERAKKLARAMRLHPGVLAFSDWELKAA